MKIQLTNFTSKQFQLDDKIEDINNNKFQKRTTRTVSDREKNESNKAWAHLVGWSIILISLVSRSVPSMYVCTLLGKNEYTSRRCLASRNHKMHALTRQWQHLHDHRLVMSIHSGSEQHTSAKTNYALQTWCKSDTEKPGTYTRTKKWNQQREKHLKILLTSHISDEMTLKVIHKTKH